MGLRSWLSRKWTESTKTHSSVRGFSVTVVNTRPDIETKDVLARLDLALGLLEQHAAHHFRRMRKDFSRILVQRYECRGAYFSADRSCMVELTFTVNPDFVPAQIAATILHEAMHARLHCVGYAFGKSTRAKEERFCRRAEIEFGQAVPGGESVVERALWSLQGSDDEIAPTIDKALAAHRIAQADLDALNAPGWIKRALARRSGLHT
jgi:hypothetical protein